MLKINMEYKKGILFVRLSGTLNRKTVKIFNSEVIPVVLKYEINKLLVNLNKLNTIDDTGIQALIELSNLVNNYKGKSVVCNINDSIKSTAYFDLLETRYFEASDEITGLGVINL